MIAFLGGFLIFFSSFLRSRSSLALEIIALRQQLGVLNRKPSRPRLRVADGLFWIFLRRLWHAWSNALVIVKPENVVSWHRAGFRLFWRFRSRSKKLGSPEITAEIKSAIRKMKSENSLWGAPRIHGELLKLGFDVSERSVSRYFHRIFPSDHARKLWTTFLHNHREVIAAMDFFTVPTITFRFLYCFFVIEHGRRKIVHFNVTDNPASFWDMQKVVFAAISPNYAKWPQCGLKYDTLKFYP